MKRRHCVVRDSVRWFSLEVVRCPKIVRADLCPQRMSRIKQQLAAITGEVATLVLHQG
jgi:hypothetical protein